ncbi:hypothetical protein R3P38DRAFT_3522272 [Favolaschia claudopus]|uniref:Uncharacterized protein n=1 Tax=Favolaschia claudopus TaxID=2862362 RepID=A0AAW0E1W4_9AGAR
MILACFTLRTNHIFRLKARVSSIHPRSLTHLTLAPSAHHTAQRRQHVFPPCHLPPSATVNSSRTPVSSSACPPPFPDASGMSATATNVRVVPLLRFLRALTQLLFFSPSATLSFPPTQQPAPTDWLSRRRQRSPVPNSTLTLFTRSQRQLPPCRFRQLFRLRCAAVLTSTARHITLSFVPHHWLYPCRRRTCVALPSLLLSVLTSTFYAIPSPSASTTPPAPLTSFTLPLLTLGPRPARFYVSSYTRPPSHHATRYAGTIALLFLLRLSDFVAHST